jgi:hypothetical protein
MRHPLVLEVGNKDWKIQAKPLKSIPGRLKFRDSWGIYNIINRYLD